MSAYNVVKQNQLAVSGLLNISRAVANKHQLCWVCQQSKSLKGGSLRTAPGYRMFVCKECIDAKHQKRAQAARPD